MLEETKYVANYILLNRQNFPLTGKMIEHCFKTMPKSIKTTRSLMDKQLLFNVLYDQPTEVLKIIAGGEDYEEKGSLL